MQAGRECEIRRAGGQEPVSSCSTACDRWGSGLLRLFGLTLPLPHGMVQAAKGDDHDPPLALVIGIVGGLRRMMAPTAIAWAAHSVG